MVNIEKFEIFSCLEKGKGIRATELIKPGEEILTEKPLVYALTTNKFRGIRCDFCFSESEQLLKCSKCKFVSYCGKGCQIGDWQVHKRECKCLVKVSPKQPPDICRLVSQLIFKYYWSKDSVTDVDRKEIENLASNREFITNSRKEAFFTFGAVLFDYLKQCPIKMEEADVYGLLCRISCNSFTITNSELNSLGTGVYKTASFLNHSCDPNCIAIFDGPNICIRSIKEIKTGEEILMSYTNILASSDVRRAELKEGYMFDCHCNVCSGKQFSDFMMRSVKCQTDLCACLISLVDETDSFTGKNCSCDKQCQLSVQSLQSVNTCSDELDAIYNEIQVVPTADQHKRLERSIKKGEEVLGVSHISLLHCYEVAMDGCLERENWEKALDYGKKLEKSYQCYLSQNHPTIGLHYFKQGKLAMHLMHLREAMDYLQKAKEVLEVSHGGKHELVKMLQNSLTQTSREMIDLENSFANYYKEEE